MDTNQYDSLMCEGNRLRAAAELGLAEVKYKAALRVADVADGSVVLAHLALATLPLGLYERNSIQFADSLRQYVAANFEVLELCRGSAPNFCAALAYVQVAEGLWLTDQFATALRLTHAAVHLAEQGDEASTIILPYIRAANGFMLAVNGDEDGLAQVAQVLPIAQAKEGAIAQWEWLNSMAEINLALAEAYVQFEHRVPEAKQYLHVALGYARELTRVFRVRYSQAEIAYHFVLSKYAVFRK
jgi:hypothetical protein